MEHLIKREKYYRDISKSLSDKGNDKGACKYWNKANELLLEIMHGENEGDEGENEGDEGKNEGEEIELQNHQ